MSYGDRNRLSTSIGTYDDDRYDARRDALDKYYRNPEKYSSQRSDSRGYSDNGYRPPERVNVVIEHWSGCSSQSVCDNIVIAIEDNFPDVHVKEFRGRFDSFEVFINGKLLYSRIMQGGYPYEEEVLEAVWRAKKGKHIHQIDRYSGSPSCNIL